MTDQRELSLESVGVPDNGFDFTPNDNTNIIDPNTSNIVIGATVTTRIDGVIRVTYFRSATPVVVPMIAGVRRSMLVSKIWATGTTAGITSGGVIVEY